jgi:hypothetical protein
MPHSTLPYRPKGATKIEERFQAGLHLQQLYALPIYQLPIEVMLNILSRLELHDFPSLVAACWHLLRHVGVADAIPTPKLRELLLWPRRGFFDSVEHAIDPARVDRGFLPPHIRRSMLSHLAPRPPFFRTFTNITMRLRGPFSRRRYLPIELRQQIFRRLDPETMINVTLAAFRFSDRHIEWLTHEEV